MEGYLLGNSIPGKVRRHHSLEVGASEGEGLAYSRASYIFYLNCYLVVARLSILIVLYCFLSANLTL